MLLRWKIRLGSMFLASEPAAAHSPGAGCQEYGGDRRRWDGSRSCSSRADVRLSEPGSQGLRHAASEGHAEPAHVGAGQRRAAFYEGISRAAEGSLSRGSGRHQDCGCTRIRVYAQGGDLSREPRSCPDRSPRRRLFRMLAGLRRTGVHSDRCPGQDSRHQPGLSRRTHVQVSRRQRRCCRRV